jgi:hypothetical protein
MIETGCFFLHDPFSNGTKSEIRYKQDNRCDKCSKRTNLEIHHIIPQVYKGKDEERNGVGLCPPCHQQADYDVLELGLTYEGNYLNEMPATRFKGDVNPFIHIHIKDMPQSWIHDYLMITAIPFLPKDTYLLPDFNIPVLQRHT